MSTVWLGSIQIHKLFNESMDTFEEQNLGIKVIGEYSAWTEYFDKLQIQIANGNPPDVFQLAPLHLIQYASKDVLMDLQDLSFLLIMFYLT